MNIPDTLLTLFTGEIQIRNGTPVVGIPARELENGELAVGERYRIAVLEPHERPTDTATENVGSDRRRSRESAEPPVKQGEVRDVEIESLGEQGDGIARVGPGYIVFVPDTKVGDRVKVEITEVLDSFGFAKVIEGEPITG